MHHVVVVAHPESMDAPAAQLVLRLGVHPCVAGGVDSAPHVHRGRALAHLSTRIQIPAGNRQQLLKATQEERCNSIKRAFYCPQKTKATCFLLPKKKAMTYSSKILLPNKSQREITANLRVYYYSQQATKLLKKNAPHPAEGKAATYQK